MQRRGGLSWDRREAARGALCCAPAAVLMLAGSTSLGAFAAIGALPVALAGVPPVRRDRLRLLVVGVVFAVAYVAGSAVHSRAVPAVALATGFAAASVVVTARTPRLRGPVGIAVPAYVLGMNVSPGAGLALGAVFFGATAWSVLVAWCWTVRTAPPPVVPPPAVTTTPVPLYAALYAAAIAIGLVIGYGGGFDHVGWVAGAAALIMRPEPELSSRRAVGRALATYLGVTIAAVLSTRGLGDVAFAVVVVAAVAVAVGTRGSRWYVTPAFTGLVVLLLAGVSGTASFHVTFAERIVETTVGAALALLFGTLLPRSLARRERWSSVRRRGRHEAGRSPV